MTIRHNQLNAIKPGLALVFISLIFGLLMGIAFGLFEDHFKDFISQGVAANPSVHDAKSSSKIWRYVQRAHFHAAGISAFCLGLLLLAAFSTLTEKMKSLCSILIGLAGLYPLAWFNMFLLAPSIGRNAAHHHIITVLITYISVFGLLIGLAILSANLFFRLFNETHQD